MMYKELIKPHSDKGREISQLIGLVRKKRLECPDQSHSMLMKKRRCHVKGKHFTR